jgi:hypothetical protein
MSKDLIENPGSKTIKELALEYKMSHKTFVKAIKPIRETLRSTANNIRVMVPNDVIIIYDYLGPPG